MADENFVYGLDNNVEDKGYNKADSHTAGDTIIIPTVNISSEDHMSDDKGFAPEPQNNEITDKEKKENAKRLATYLVQGYEWLHGFAYTKLEFGDKRAAKKLASHEVFNIVINPQTRETFHDAIVEYNEAIAEILEVKSINPSIEVELSIREELIAGLTDIFAKRGWGVSASEGFYMIFLLDAIKKAALLIRRSKQMDNMAAQVNEMYKQQLRASGGKVSAPITNNPTPDEQPIKPTKKEKPTYDTTKQESVVEPLEIILHDELTPLSEVEQSIEA